MTSRHARTELWRECIESGVGLANIRERLALVTGGTAARLTLGAASPDGGFRARRRGGHFVFAFHKAWHDATTQRLAGHFQLTPDGPSLFDFHHRQAGEIAPGAGQQPAGERGGQAHHD